MKKAVKRIVSFAVSFAAAAVLFSGIASDTAVLPSLSITAEALTSADLCISDNGFWFICGSEGFSSTCYPDASQSSIGYGTKCTGSSEQPHAKGLHSITEPEARAIAKSQIDNRYSATVRKQTVGLEMNQNQFDALVSLAYNTGGGTTIIANSPLVLYLKGKYSEATARSAYSSYYVKSNGVVLQGLINRRNREADLFFTNSHVHDYSLSFTIYPTCECDGSIRYICSCGDYYDETLNALGHDYAASYTLPTMTTAGIVKYTCSRCGDSYNGETIPAPVLNADGWYYSTVLPQGITTDNCTIQYNNHYETVQTSAPSSEWTQGSAVSDEWVNTGDCYDSWYELPTSDSRVLIDSYFYHYCSGSTGTVVNYEATSQFVHGDSVAIDLVNVEKTGLDGDITYYILTWKNDGTRVYCNSNSTCDGSYGTHGNRGYAWYKKNWYQDRYRVIKYLYTKDSGWVSSADASANSTSYRFKYKVSKPSKPTNVKATAGDKQATLSWTGVSGAVNYAVYKYENGSYGKVATTTNTSYTVKGLTNGTAYKFLVRAFNTAGGSSFTTADLVSVTPKSAVTTVPAKPTVSANVGDKVVTFSWSKASGATYYKLYNYSGGKYGLITTTTETSYRLRYLKNGTTYKILVRAFNDKGGSAFTTADLISVTPKAATAVPDKPVVKATVSSGNVILNWAHVPTAFSYTIYKYENGTYTKLGATCDNYFTVKGLTAGKTYSILVRSFNSKGGHKVTSADRVSVTL